MARSLARSTLPPVGRKSSYLTVRLTPELLGACEALAEGDGLSLSEWVRAELARLVRERRLCSTPATLDAATRPSGTQGNATRGI